MKSYSLEHLADSTLLHGLDTLDARDRGTTAHLLAHLGEVDARKLYLPTGFPSMHAYCVGHRKYSEDIAYKRIRAARAARRFRAIFTMLAEGRLHLSGVVLLAPYLIDATADELLAASVHKTKAEIEQLLVARFPKPDVPTSVVSLAATTYACQLAPGPVELGIQTEETPPVRRSTEPALSAETVPAAPAIPTVPAPVAPPISWSRIIPLAPGRFAFQVTIDQETHDLLSYAQALLGHTIPSGDLRKVLKRLVQKGIAQLERDKSAACARSRPRRPGRKPDGRYIPADVRLAVWQRDQGRCTFVSDSGQRCPATRPLEFDHVHEFACGGGATVSGIRLLCRAHNQYQAERTFGVEFMRRKREAARERTQQRRARMTAAADPAPEREEDPERDVAPWLRALGIRGDDLRRGVAAAATIPDAPLDERVRLAVSTLTRAGRRQEASIASSA